jgi:hypothetical protein
MRIMAIGQLTRYVQGVLRLGHSGVNTPKNPTRIFTRADARFHRHRPASGHP